MRIIQNSFVGGEVSPSIFGRHDIEQYFHSAKEITNFEVMPQGGLRKRAGTEFLWAYDSTELFDEEPFRSSAKRKAFRCVPFFYDRTNWAVVVLFTIDDEPFRKFVESPDHPHYNDFMTRVAVANAVLNGTFSSEEEKASARIALDTAHVVFYEQELEAVKAAEAAWEACDKTKVDDSVAARRAVLEARRALHDLKGYDALERASKGVFYTIVSSDGTYAPARPCPYAEEMELPEILKDGAVHTDPVTGERCERIAGSVPMLPRVRTRKDGTEEEVFGNLRYKQIGDTLYFFGRGYRACKVMVKKDGNRYVLGDWYLIDSGKQVPTPSKEKTNFSFRLNGFRPAKENLKDGNRTGYVVSERRYGVVGLKDGKTSAPLEIAVQKGPGKWQKTDGTLEENNECEFTTGWTPGATIDITFTADWEAYDSYQLCVLYAGNWGVLKTFTDKSTSTCTMKDDNITPGEVAALMTPIPVGDDNTYNVENVETWEQRIMLSGCEGRPFTIWFSRTGDVNNFYNSRPQNSDDAFEVTLPVTIASRIQHVIGNNALMLFTESSEYVVRNADSGFSHESIVVQRVSQVGSSPSVNPAGTAMSALFCGADNKTIYEMAYTAEQDGYTPTNRSLLSSHMTEGSRIRQMVFERYPVNELHCLLENGDVISMTYCPEQKVFAWWRSRFGGSQLKVVDILNTGAVWDVDGTEVKDVVVLVCEGENGSLYLERMRSHSYGDSPKVEDAYCADHVGYPLGTSIDAVPVSAKCVTVRPEMNDFNSLGIYKNVSEVVLRMNKSGNVRVKPEVEGDDGSFRVANSSYQETYQKLAPCKGVEMGTYWGVGGHPKGLFTKDVRLMPFAYQNTDGRLVIESDDGWPCEIQSVNFEMDVADYGKN